MRIAIVVHGLDGGGVARVVTWLADQLVADGHDVSLVVRTPAHADAYPLDERVGVVRLEPPHPARYLPRAGRRWVDRAVLAMAARRAARSADLVVSFIVETNVAVLLALLGESTPVIVAETSHPFAREGELRPVVRRLRPPLYRRAAAVVVLTDEIAGLARERWRLANVHVVPNAVLMTPPAAAPSVLDRPRRVLAVGKLREVKDHRTLLEAWARTSARHHGWTLTIVGEGPLRSDLEAVIEQLGIADTASLPGATTDVMARYLTSQIFVLPSQVEGVPNVLLEAMACGCACIVTDCPGAPTEMVGDAGVVVPVWDAVALAAAIDRLVAQPELRAGLALAAVDRLGDYQPDRVLTLWRSLVTSSPPLR